MPSHLYCAARRSLPSSFLVHRNPIPTFLLPFLNTTHQRHASILSDLRDNPGAHQRLKRVGRGPSSGRGKTSTRGHKGQKQRGKVPAGFNGGQTPLAVIKGKRGFRNLFTDELKPLNLSKLASWIAQKRIDPQRPITVKELLESRCVSSVKDGVKLLAGRPPGALPPSTSTSTAIAAPAQAGVPPFPHPIQIIVSRASSSAIAAIEAAGGAVHTRYYTPFAIRAIAEGKMDPISSLDSRFPEALVNAVSRGRRYLHRLPDPTARRDIEYYRDPAKRGYLSHMVPEGEGPSLFFRRPRFAAAAAGEGEGGREEKRKKKDEGAANRLW